MTGTPLGNPTNDQCYGTLITSLPYADSGNTTCAATDYNMTCTAASSRDVVYNLFLFEGRYVSASLCGSSYDTQLIVTTGGACPGTTVIQCNDDACGEQSVVNFYAEAYTDYYVFVDGDGAYGAYTLNVTEAPAPDCPARGDLVAILP